MNRTLLSQLSIYYRTIYKLLPGSSREKKKYIHTLKINIESYIATNSVTDFSEIYVHFGSAEEIADAFLSEKTNVTICNQINQLNLVNFFIVLAIIGMIAFFFIFVRILRSIPLETVIM